MDGEKYKCICGSNVLKKNLSSHNKTVKHLKATGVIPTLPPEPILKPQKTVKLSPVPELICEVHNDEMDDDSDNGEDEEFFAEMEEVHNRLDEIEDKLDNLMAMLVKYLKIEVPKQPGKPANFSMKPNPSVETGSLNDLNKS